MEKMYKLKDGSIERLSNIQTDNDLVRMGCLNKDTLNKYQDAVEIDYFINIYRKNKDNTERYVLGADIYNPLIVIGLNPSTADDTRPDNTIRRIMAISAYNKHNGFIMLNLYPLRSTNPNDLPSQFDTNAHAKNLFEIENIFKTHTNHTLLLAYGNHLCDKKLFYFKICLDDIINLAKKYQMNLKTLGELSKKGCPKHPLYIKTNTPLLDFKA